MKSLLLILLLFIAVFIEGTLVQLPLVLLVLSVVAVIYREKWIFPLGFITGILLDGVTFHPLGSRSLFYTIILFLVFLYERKFELRSIWFIILISFIESLLFFFFFGYVLLIQQIMISCAVGVVLFFMISFFHPLPRKDTVQSWKR